MLSCTKEINISSKDIYDTLLTLFNGMQSQVVSNEVYVKPIQVSNEGTDQPIFDANLHDAFLDEQYDIEESQTMPK